MDSTASHQEKEKQEEKINLEHHRLNICHYF